MCESLQIDWQLHAPWHLQSSGQVERMNQTLKNNIIKLKYETGLPWTKCLPSARFRIRTGPKKDVEVSPFELLFRIPYSHYQKELAAT